MAFDTEGFTIRTQEGEKQLTVSEDEYLLLHLHYDDQGNIPVTTGQSKKSQ